MVVLLPLDSIDVNWRNPRQQFDQEELLALAHSIAHHGVLQPILVARAPGRPERFRLVAGERRWRASRLAQCATIPVIITDGENEALLRDIQLDENLQRVQLTPLEEARAFEALQQEYGYSIADLSRRFHRTQNFIRDRLALLSLCPQVQQTLADGRLTVGAAMALRMVEDEKVQTRFAVQVIEGRMTVEQTQNLVRGYRREQRLQALRRKRVERRAQQLQQLSRLGPVVTSESYQAEKHHRIWDLCFPECQTCSLKGHFLRDDAQIEEVCVLPDCYNMLLEHGREAHMHRLQEQRKARLQAFSRVLNSDEVTETHLLYLLWTLVYDLLGPMSSLLRAELGLPAYSITYAARSTDWDTICTWPHDRVLKTIFEICVSTLAALPNELLPQGMKQSLIVHFAFPPEVVGEVSV